DAESGVTARIDQAASSVGQSARAAADQVEARLAEARDAITEMVDDRLGTLPEAITTRAEITAERLAGLNQSIHGTITDSMRDLEAGADRIESTLTGSIQSAIGLSMADLES